MDPHNPSIKPYEWLNRSQIVRVLETVQDVIVISMYRLFSVIAIQLRAMPSLCLRLTSKL